MRSGEAIRKFKMQYWAVWPIVVVQISAFILMFVRQTARPCNVSIRIWVIVLLMVASIAIVMSLYHNAAPLSHLYF